MSQALTSAVETYYLAVSGYGTGIATRGGDAAKTIIPGICSGFPLKRKTEITMKFIDSNHSQLLARAMDTYALRQRITATNIANADTPGFKKHEVHFEKELQGIQQKEGAKGMKEVNPTIVETDRDVVLEDELLEMTDTQVRVHLVTRSLRHHFSMLRTGITGVNR